MNKKTGLFIVLGLLAAPLLIYLILHAGKQRFTELPYFGERIPPNGREVKDTIYYTVPDFSLTDQEGKTITRKDFANSIYVANFFFASCEGVCPAMNKRLKAVYDRMKEFAEVKFISHTVDPDHDSVPVLKEYAKQYGADPAIWHFVTGSREDIFKAGRGYLLPVSIEDRTVDHSQQLILVDKAGHIRGVYDGLDDAEMERLQDEIKVLLYSYQQ
jgi:protein SCO1/2